MREELDPIGRGMLEALLATTIIAITCPCGGFGIFLLWTVFRLANGNE
jgi:hypothetical protein